MKSNNRENEYFIEFSEDDYFTDYTFEDGYDVTRYEQQNDPNSEVSRQAEELIENLRKSIKHEYEDRLRSLEEEIKELKHYRDEKDLFDITVSSLKSKVTELERDIEKRAKRLRLEDFIDMMYAPCYVVCPESDYVLEKCQKCDDNRLIHFKSPSGKDMTEPCICSTKKVTYIVSEATMISFAKDDIRPNQEFPGLYVEFLSNHELVKIDRLMSSELYTYRMIYDKKEPLDEIDSYHLVRQYYRDREDAKTAARILTDRLENNKNN